MEVQKNDKRFVFWLLVVATIFVLIMLTLMWSGYGKWKDKEGNPVEMTIGKNLIASVVLILVLLFGYWMFNHQKKLDIEQQHLNKQISNK